MKSHKPLSTNRTKIGEPPSAPHGATILNDVATYPGDGTSTGNTVISNLMSGADYFYRTWKISETQKNNVP
jgi:hypothetical protein